MGELPTHFAATARRVGARLARERLLLVLAAGFVILLALRPGEWSNLGSLVDWNTIGALANLIALRLAREPGLWREFHLWSIPALAVGGGAALILNAVFPDSPRP